MKVLRYLALLSILCLPAAYAHGQVAFGVGVAPYYGGYYAPPACAYAYYPSYPYACAPYGYYGPEWFSGGLFVGAGPWFRGGYGGYYGRGYGYGYGRGGYPIARGGYYERGAPGYAARGYAAAPRGLAGGGARGGFGGGGAHFSGGGGRGGGHR